MRSDGSRKWPTEYAYLEGMYVVFMYTSFMCAIFHKSYGEKKLNFHDHTIASQHFHQINNDIIVNYVDSLSISM